LCIIDMAVMPSKTCHHCAIVQSGYGSDAFKDMLPLGTRYIIDMAVMPSRTCSHYALVHNRYGR
jgi:hypothetical protein